MENMMICPIRFIRKPDEAECIREQCSFWLEQEEAIIGEKEPERFYAVLGAPSKDSKEHREQKSIGHCAVLAIAQNLTKQKP
jgi:hypothetical protein